MMPDLPARASELTKAVRELTTRMDALATAHATYAKTQRIQTIDLRRQKRTMRAAIAAMIIDIVLTFAAGYLLINQVSLNKQSFTTTNEVLCPLLGLFVSSYRPSSVPVDQRTFYETAFAKLRVMQTKLQCPGR